MAKITSVLIRRFKRLEEIEIPLSDVTLLVGANNSGKSSVLQAIHFAVAIAQTSKLIGSVNWQVGRYELSFNPAQLLYSPGSDVLSLATGGYLQEARPSQIEVQFTRADGEACLVALRRGRNRNIAVTIEGRSLGEELQQIDHPFSIYAPGLAGVPKEEQFHSPGVVRRIVARGDANLVLRNVLLLLSQNQPAWDKFLPWIRSIFPDIDLNIIFDPQTDENIQVLVSHQAGPYLPIDSAGTSILQACQLLAYIALFNPRILILDEPDSHLHPDNQRRLLATIQEIARDVDTQVLVSTHSRHVLDAARHRASVVWISNGAAVQTPDPPTLDVLLDIGALDSIDFFTNGQIKCVVMTEDTDTRALAATLWASGFHEDETYIGSYSGVSKVEAAKVLGSFLRDKAPGITTIIHRDRDYLTPAESTSYIDGLTGSGVRPFLTPLNDIEANFVNADHIAHLNMTISSARATELIEQAVALARDETISTIVNVRTQAAFARRRDGGPAPDHGKIAVDAHRDYAGNPGTMTRGKSTLSRLIGLIQQEIGANPVVFQPSPHIAVPELAAVAAQLWPPAPL